MIFADTSFWVALQIARDDHHEEARTLWQRRPRAVLTTNHVIGESWTFLRRRVDHGAARAFFDAVHASPAIDVSHVGEEVEDDAWRWLLRHNERPYSFVDATSFAVMRRRRVREALAFDGDFAAAGFVEKRP